MDQITSDKPGLAAAERLTDVDRPVSTYEEFIAWLENVPHYGHKDGTRNMQEFMRRRHHPERQGGKILHTAGTNGKGSCCAMLSSVLRACGYKTGLYTSPHLVDYPERIQVDGVPISRKDFLRLGLTVREEITRMTADGLNHLTFFEILTCMAFLYFAEQKTDFIVLETGVGGLLDATNIAEPPELVLTLITSISLDHTKVLGSTVEQIAEQKAGILRPGVPVVLGMNPAGVQEVIRSRARELGSPYVYADDLRRAQGYRLSLTGEYQRQNLAVVLAGVDELRRQGVGIREEALRQGLEKTSWPGRMEERTFQGRPLLIDGAHNPGGAHMLAEYLARHYQAGECTLVYSALGKKDIASALGMLRDCPAIGQAVFTKIHGEDSLERFQQIWGKEKPFCCADEPAKALSVAASLSGEGTIVAAGSLYLVGELLRAYPELQ